MSYVRDLQSNTDILLLSTAFSSKNCFNIVLLNSCFILHLINFYIVESKGRWKFDDKVRQENII